MQVEVVLGRTIEDLESAGRRAAEVLGAGGLVIHPTETFYGIGGDGSTANNELLAKVKARSSAQPLILLIPDRERLRYLHPTLEWPRAADDLARRFWPGPLTMVVPCAEAPKRDFHEVSTVGAGFAGDLAVDIERVADRVVAADRGLRGGQKSVVAIGVQAPRVRRLLLRRDRRG